MTSVALNIYLCVKFVHVRKAFISPSVHNQQIFFSSLYHQRRTMSAYAYAATCTLYGIQYNHKIWLERRRTRIEHDPHTIKPQSIQVYLHFLALLAQSECAGGVLIDETSSFMEVEFWCLLHRVLALENFSFLSGSFAKFENQNNQNNQKIQLKHSICHLHSQIHLIQRLAFNPVSKIFVLLRIELRSEVS